MTQNIHEVPMDSLIEIDTIDYTKAQEAASLCFTRRERFVGGYDHKREQIKLMNEFFGELGTLYSTGLIAQFKNLREKIIKENLIGLVLSGINDKNTLINRYTQQDKTTILNLTISSLSRTLLRNHFTEEEINDLCLKTPNFHIYYIKEND